MPVMISRFFAASDWRALYRYCWMATIASEVRIPAIPTATMMSTREKAIRNQEFDPSWEPLRPAHMRKKLV
jgi:hypothetical protein